MKTSNDQRKALGFCSCYCLFPKLKYLHNDDVLYLGQHLFYQEAEVYIKCETNIFAPPPFLDSYFSPKGKLQ